VERPLRLSVTDVFKGTGAGGTVSVSGKVDTGVLGAGDTVLVMPLREGATVKGAAAAHARTRAPSSLSEPRRTDPPRRRSDRSAGDPRHGDALGDRGRERRRPSGRH